MKSPYEQPCTCRVVGGTLLLRAKNFVGVSIKTPFTWSMSLARGYTRSGGQRQVSVLGTVLVTLFVLCKAMTITDWMPVRLKKQVQVLRQTTDFKKRSEQNKKNKTSRPNAGSRELSTLRDLCRLHNKLCIW